MNFLNYIKRIFIKTPEKTVDLTEFETGLKKWEDFRWIHLTFISDIIQHCNLNDLAIALVHCEKPIFDRFLQTAKGLFYTEALTKSLGDDLEKLINKNSELTKRQNDKMKAHIANNILHPDYIKYRNLPYGQSPRKS